MPLPKRRHSRTRGRKRRTHYKMVAPTRSVCPQCREVKLPAPDLPALRLLQGARGPDRRGRVAAASPLPMKIALDAMGGDFGPAVVVEGAVVAAREYGIASVLVGDKAAIEREIVRLKAQDLPLSIRHATQVVGMAESPSQALRRKRDSSLRVAAELVKDGECHALVSAGNTGAAMAIGMFVLGLLPGVERPAIAAALPSLAGFTVLIDAGANVDPKPRHLFQFAVMGHVYSRDIIGKDNPRVGLLSVGEEEGKGNELVKDTFESLRGSSLNFIGNIEGRDIYNGRCDVVVTDGFTGNVCLKVSESLAEMLTSMIREELTRDVLSKAGAVLAQRGVRPHEAAGGLHRDGRRAARSASTAPPSSATAPRR